MTDRSCNHTGPHTADCEAEVFRVTPGQAALLRRVRLRAGKRRFGEACDHCGRRFM